MRTAPTRTHHRRAASLGVAALVLLALTSPAAAAPVAGHSLALAGPSSATTGSPMVLTASGTVPDDVFLNRYVNVYAIPASVGITQCPEDYTSGMQLAYETSSKGGHTVANHVQVDGSFTTPIAWTPTHTGPFLLCGYLHEGVETMATAQHATTVSEAVVAPRNVTRPRLERVRSRLACSRGTWSGNPASYGYRWRIDGRISAGATGRTLRIRRSLRGATVVCLVTARNSAGSARAASNRIRVR